MKEARSTLKRRLEASGYSYVAGWLPDEIADQVRQALRDHARRVERIKDEGRLRGNPNWRGKNDG